MGELRGGGGSSGGKGIQAFSSVAIPSNTAISSGGLTAIGSIAATVSVSGVNDVIEISLSGIGQSNHTSGDHQLGYKVDSAAAVNAWYMSRGNQTDTTEIIPILWSRRITGLSAGSHTIALMGGGTNAWALLGDTDSAYADGGTVHFDVTVFKG